MKKYSVTQVIKHVIDKMVEMALNDEFPMDLTQLNAFELENGLDSNIEVVQPDRFKTLVQLTDENDEDVGLVYTRNFPELSSQWNKWCEVEGFGDVDGFIEHYNENNEDSIVREFVKII